MYRVAVFVLIWFAFQVCFGAQPTQTNGFFRSGQTFLTWCEDIGQTGESYRIYRSSQPITSGNVASATMVIEVKEGSSYFREMHACNGSILGADPWYIGRFVIQPVTLGSGTQLSDTTGLFVYTVLEESQVESYYAVTTVSSGGTEEMEISSDNSIGPVTETKQYPDAVKYYVGPEDTDFQRDYFILWLDHRTYNPFTGNVTPFAISNKNYGAHYFTSGGSPYIHLDGIGTQFPAAPYSNYGNMDYGTSGQPTWYFGHHMSSTYNGGCGTVGGSALQDTIANYVQYKHMQVVLWARRHFNITEPKFHIIGNSMGASGAYGFLMAFPSFVTSIWSNEGMTQYSNPGLTGGGDTIWAGSIWANYGHHSLANPVKFLPFNDPAYPDLDWATQFNGMNVYDVRNVVTFLTLNTAKSFGVVSGGHCYEDDAIPFAYQAVPLEAYLKNSRHCFGYGVRHGGHGWGQASYGSQMESYMRWDESRPGFSNVPAMEGCMYNDPAYPDTGSRTYMSFVRWGTIEAPIFVDEKKIVETGTSWSIPIINASRCANKDAEYTVDITPRNLQELETCEDDTFAYTIKNAAESATEATGDIVVDSLQLLLIPNVPIRQTGAVASVTLKNRGPNYPCADMDPPMHTVMNGIPAPEAGPFFTISPNPFNPVVTIAFGAGILSVPQVAIYAITGKMIADLSAQVRNGRVAWNASGYPSGVYIVKAIANGRMLSKRIMMIK